MRYPWFMPDGTAGRSATRARIVDAATNLLREQGSAGVTTRGVAEDAGVQAPAIYRLFGDKDGLLEAVAENVMATYVSAKAAIVEAAAADEIDPLEDLRVGWDTQIEFGLTNPAVFRLLSDPDRAMHSPAARSGKHVLESRVHRVALTGRLRVSEQRCVDIIQAAGMGTIQVLLSTPAEYRDPGLTDAMYETVLGQILTKPPQRPEERPLATAVTIRALLPRFDMLSDAERQLMDEWLGRVIEAL
jgi:AcrR family transcriptional regulator